MWWFESAIFMITKFVSKTYTTATVQVKWITSIVQQVNLLV